MSKRKKVRSDTRRFKEHMEHMEAARATFIDTGIADIKNSSYSIGVQFPLHVWRTTEDPTYSLRRIAKEFGGQDVGSGAGLGMRDVDFAFKTLLETLAFMESVRRANNPFVHLVGAMVAASDGIDGIHEQIEWD